MNGDLTKKIDIFLTVDRNVINNYFNPHDPAPIYKRQLRHDVVTYIAESVATYTRYSSIRYKVSCNEKDKELVEPFMRAVYRHYKVKEQIKRLEFYKFKKRSFKLLFISLFIILICQVVLPALTDNGHEVHSTIGSSLDIFSWVVLWTAIDRLLFSWNPHLKAISLLHKLATAEVIVMEYASAQVETKIMVRA